MKAINYISRKEYNLLLIVTFTAFLIVGTIFAWQAVKDYNYSIYHEQISLLHQANYGRPGGFPYGQDLYVLPGLHFLTLFIFIALLKTKKFLIPLLLTVFYLFTILYGLSARYESNILASPSIHLNLYKEIYLIANIYDFTAFFFAVILLFWQISILLRMLIKTIQRKRVLP